MKRRFLASIAVMAVVLGMQAGAPAQDDAAPAQPPAETKAASDGAKSPAPKAKAKTKTRSSASQSKARTARATSNIFWECRLGAWKG